MWLQRRTLLEEKPRPPTHIHYVQVNLEAPGTPPNPFLN